jgi:hypothetical protein
VAVGFDLITEVKRRNSASWSPELLSVDAAADE